MTRTVVSPREAESGREADGRPCVVHLVREANGPQPLREFLDTYRRHDAGVDHRLILLFKGFADAQAAEPHRRLADGLAIEELFVSDQGFDLTAYRRAADALRATRYCFLNSHSRIQAGGWLAHLDGALVGDRVGIAGASGSWASILSFALFNLGLPGVYSSVFDGRRETLRQFREIDRDRVGKTDSTSSRRQLLNTAIALGPLLAGFRRFPAHHIRTNAFAIRHEVLVRALNPTGRSKKEALQLESGRHSVTCTVEHMGLRAVVVDRSGRSYEPTSWDASETFWQGAQGGLLVADNQTEQYRLGDARRKRLLARFAWGEDARPSREPV